MRPRHWLFEKSPLSQLLPSASKNSLSVPWQVLNKYEKPSLFQEMTQAMSIT